jgi:hypothetical protein
MPDYPMGEDGEPEDDDQSEDCNTFDIEDDEEC